MSTIQRALPETDERGHEAQPAAATQYCIGPENTGYYLIVVDFGPVRLEVEPNTLIGSWQRRPTNQESREHHIRESGCKDVSLVQHHHQFKSLLKVNAG